MGKANRRPQASKRVRNEAMGKAFRELRNGSRAQPHANRYRAQKVRGWDWED